MAVKDAGYRPRVRAEETRRGKEAADSEGKIERVPAERAEDQVAEKASQAQPDQREQQEAERANRYESIQT